VVYENPLGFFRQSNRWKDFASAADVVRNGAVQSRVAVKA
jgi:hypothetical protein